MEEFILRISANSSALKSELVRTGAWVKAWATTLAEDFKGKIGRMFAAGFVLDKGIELAKRALENIQEKILAIKRAQGELPGVSSNFIQGVFNQLDRVGLSFEQISKPLLQFKRTLDAAKMNPGGAEMRTLERYNIVTSEADLKTQKYAASVAKLSEAYLKAGKNLQALKDIVGRQALDPAMLALLEVGPEKIAAMDKFNPFSDISQNAINLSTGVFSSKKGLMHSLTAISANVLEKLSVQLGTTVLGDEMFEPLTNLKAKLMAQGHGENDAATKRDDLQRSIEQEEQRVSIQSNLVALKERELELSSEIADRGKASLEQMANEARRLTGQTSPRLYRVTDRQRAALNIQTLEEKARIAFESGDDKLHDNLMNQAQKLRASSPWLMDKDRNPLRKTESQLEIVNAQLAPVKKMAEMVNKDSR